MYTSDASAQTLDWAGNKTSLASPCPLDVFELTHRAVVNTTNSTEEPQSISTLHASVRFIMQSLPIQFPWRGGLQTAMWRGRWEFSAWDPSYLILQLQFPEYPGEFKVYPHSFM